MRRSVSSNFDPEWAYALNRYGPLAVLPVLGLGRLADMRADSGNSTPLRSRAAFRRDSATTDSAHSGESPPGTLGVARVRAVPVEWCGSPVG